MLDRPHPIEPELVCEPRLLERVKSTGAKVLSSATTVAEARWLESRGCDAIIAQGAEAGGHRGMFLDDEPATQVGTFALVPQVADAVPVPVIAAGGIADGRGLAAALMLGASGVQMGTRFLVAKECTVHPNYKQKVLKARDIDTIATGKRLGHPVRSLKNAYSRDYFKKEYDSSVSDVDLEALGGGALYRAAKEGDEKNGCFLAGQVAGMVRQEQPAAEIIREVCDEAEQQLRGATQWVS